MRCPNCEEGQMVDCGIENLQVLLCKECGHVIINEIPKEDE